MQTIQPGNSQAQASVQHCPCPWKVRPFSRDRPTKARRQAINRSHGLEGITAANQQQLQVSSSLPLSMMLLLLLLVSVLTLPALTFQPLQTFPSDYPTAMRQAQAATLAALEDGHKLIEVEFPTSSLQGVSGTSPLLPMLPVLHPVPPTPNPFPPLLSIYTFCKVRLEVMVHSHPSSHLLAQVAAPCQHSALLNMQPSLHTCKLICNVLFKHCI